MKRLGLLFLASCFAALSSTWLIACDAERETITCTMKGCLSDLTLDMPEEGLAPGLWIFEVDADGERWVCEASIPFPTEHGASCEGPYGGWLVRFYGEPMPAYFHLLGNPAKVSVKVTHEDETVLQREIEPTYETFTIDNGHEFCDVTCASARLPLWPAED